MDIREFSANIRVRSERLAKIVSACRSLFKASSEAAEAREYIGERLSEKSIKDFGVGYWPPNNKIGLLYSLIGKDTIMDASLMWEEKYSNRGHMEVGPRGFFHHHNLIFPYSDEYGNIVALAGRSILDSDRRSELKIPKYKNTVFNKSMHLFGLNKAKRSIEENNGVIVVEGQIDVINCHANGFFNTVAMTGSELSMYQAYLIKKKTDNIYLLLDNDDAGRKAESKILKKFAHTFDIKRLRLPTEYNDVDEYLSGTTDRSIFNVCKA